MLNLDADLNGVPDLDENLLSNGSFSRVGPVQLLDSWTTEGVPSYRQGDLVYNPTSADARGLDCSAAVSVTTLDVFTDANRARYFDQCVVAAQGSYLASAQATLLANGLLFNDLVTVDYDPSVVSIELSAFETANCQNAIIGEEASVQVELAPDGAWHSVATALEAGSATQSLRVRLSVLADLGDGLQAGANRIVGWDNVILGRTEASSIKFFEGGSL